MSEDYGLNETQRRAAIETASQVAHVAAAGVFKAQAAEGDDAREALYWFNDGVPYTPPGLAAPIDDLLASDALAEFQYGLEPNGETLYREARYKQMHDLDRDAFATQPARIRIAFEIFARTAVAVFQAIAAEARRAAPEVPVGAVNLSPQMLEKIGDDSDERELQDPHRVAAIRAAAEAPVPEDKPKKKRGGRKPKAETPLPEEKPKKKRGGRKPKAETPPADGAPETPAADAAPGEGAGGEDGDDDEDVLEGLTVEIAPLSAEDGGGFLATVAELPGCTSDGATEEEARDHLRDAVVAWRAAAAQAETAPA